MNAMSKRGIPQCCLCRLPLRDRDGTPHEPFYRQQLFVHLLAHRHCARGLPAEEFAHWRYELVGCRPADDPVGKEVIRVARETENATAADRGVRA